MENEPVKQYTNLDLIVPEKDFKEAITQDFIDDSFIDQVEWAMLMVQQRMKQMFHSENTKEVSMNMFDKAYLLGSGIDEVATKLQFAKGFDEWQATPQIFPNLNMKIMNISSEGDDGIVYLSKVRELAPIDKRGLDIKLRYAYDYSLAFFNKKTEAFYALREGYCVNDKFFKKDLLTDGEKVTDLIKPFSLRRGYYTQHQITWYSDDIVQLTLRQINMAYQIALTMYYEWSLYIKDVNSIGLIIPIDPIILSDIYDTSLLKFENRKAMLHFVREHYRSRPMAIIKDYSVFVNRYLRGEYKFDYRGFSAEIIPPKYDLNRVKTRKKFINPNE